MMCYENCCRLCLKDLSGPGIDCTTISELKDAILILFDVQILRTDATRCICNKCFENVMAFKAFKKTVHECQKIIQDYETIKKKIFEYRAMIPIKEEVIDLSEPNGLDVQHQSIKSKRKRPILNNHPVTDSQINDVLDLVHDNSLSAVATRNTNTKSSSSNKKSKVCSVSVPSTSTNARVKTESVSISSPSITPALTPSTELEQMTEPTSSTSISTNNNNIANLLELNDKICSDSACSTSTSGVGSSLDSQNQIHVKKEQSQNLPVTAKELKRKRNNDTCSETVSSSVQITSEEQQKNSPVSVSQTLKSANINYIITNNVGQKRDKNFFDISPFSKGWIRCPRCDLNYKNIKALKIHLLKRHQIGKDDIKSCADLSIKRLYSEENSVSSFEEFNTSSRTRSSRQAKSQAIKKMHSTSITRRPQSKSLYESSNKHRSLISTISKHSYSNQANQSFGKASDSNEIAHISNSVKNHEHTPNRKRVITITLLKTKDSVNFRYCDQYKKSIDFNTVSPEELEDIRNSLMIPEIWENLTKVFKASPPDDYTHEQLRKIFGEDFHF